MNYYETLLIIHPALEAGRLKDTILSVEENLKNEKVAILSIDVWGKKRLAYLIEKQKYGTYVKIQFSGLGNIIKKLEIELQHNTNILSYLTQTINKSNILEQNIDLDSQLVGQAKEFSTTSDQKEINKDQAISNENEGENSTTAENETETENSTTAEENVEE